MLGLQVEIAPVGANHRGGAKALLQLVHALEQRREGAHRRRSIGSRDVAGVAAAGRAGIDQQ